MKPIAPPRTTSSNSSATAASSSSSTLTGLRQSGTTGTHQAVTSPNSTGSSVSHSLSAAVSGASSAAPAATTTTSSTTQPLHIKHKDVVLTDSAQVQAALDTLHRQVAELEREKTQLIGQLEAAKQEVISLGMRLDKATSVLDQKGGSGDRSSLNREKKFAVSGESGLKISEDSLKRIDKPAVIKDIIRTSILQNEFLQNMEQQNISEIIECMYMKVVAKSANVIQEGNLGSHLYVAETGKFEVSKDNALIRKFDAPCCFGELALLYNCNRTATVKAVTEAKLWVIDRNSFLTILRGQNVQKHEARLQFLKSVPLLKDLNLERLTKLADVLETQDFQQNDCLIRENENADSFFIIQSGTVLVKQLDEATKEEKSIRNLTVGNYFGEQALINETRRTATIVATSVVQVLCLYIKDFKELIGDLSELKTKDYGDRQRIERQISKVPEVRFKDISLQQFTSYATLGVGGFGRVELVTFTNDTKTSYALKSLKKSHIVQTKQQTHVVTERKLLLEIDCAFIIKLYGTFRDTRYVYMLMEPCLGGELWSVLRDKQSFDENVTRFCLACVILGIEYLNELGIVYRDLKPENLLLDSKGYLKMCDFGFAKKIGAGNKTFTFCGTPEYVAPEIILNKGHSFSVDYWSMGILAMEVHTGFPPFSGQDPLKIYTQILKGIDSLDLHKRKKLSNKAVSFIRKLCRMNPSERLGVGKGGIDEIKSHKFYQGFNWSSVASQQAPAPFQPKISGATDFSNFDHYPPDTSVVPEEMSGWDSMF